MMRFLLTLVMLTVPAVAQHTVALQWNASTTPNVTYNVYRGTSSGSYTLQLNPSPVICCTFTDAQVVDGTTYYYIAKSFDSSHNLESVASNEASAVIPVTTPPPPPPCPPHGGGKNCKKH